MASGPAIGAAWVAAHGQGRLPAEKLEELRSQLLQDIEVRGGAKASSRAQSEVDQFLRNGRVSASNLQRLERRVFAMAGEGSLSARGEGSRSISEFSQSTSARREPPQSARQPSRQSNPELDALLKALAPGAAPGGEARARLEAGQAPKLPSVPEAVAQELGKWSQVAKYAKAVEDLEKEQKRETARSRQQQMRQELDQQIAEKTMQKQRMEAEDREHFKRQEADLVRWRQTQELEREDAKNRALQVNKEREVQRQRTLQRQEEEHAKKKEEDGKLVQRAAQELDAETKLLHNRKLQKMRQQQQMALDMKEEGKMKEEQKKLQVAEERRKVKEYHQMLEEQQVRNRSNIVVRTVPELPAPPEGPRGREAYHEENVMQQLTERNRQAEEAEAQRRERMKHDRQSNQDFLFQQIAERDIMRRQVQDSKGSAKKAAQDATMEYIETERRRIEEQRTKNAQYRLELERQISAKKASQLPKQAEDQMSRAERAINRRLLREVVELQGFKGSPQNQAVAAGGGDRGT